MKFYLQYSTNGEDFKPITLKPLLWKVRWFFMSRRAKDKHRIAMAERVSRMMPPRWVIEESMKDIPYMIEHLKEIARENIGKPLKGS
jgi:hypothetical protein